MKKKNLIIYLGYLRSFIGICVFDYLLEKNSESGIIALILLLFVITNFVFAVLVYLRYEKKAVYTFLLSILLAIITTIINQKDGIIIFGYLITLLCIASADIKEYYHIMFTKDYISPRLIEREKEKAKKEAKKAEYENQFKFKEKNKVTDNNGNITNNLYPEAKFSKEITVDGKRTTLHYVKKDGPIYYLGERDKYLDQLENEFSIFDNKEKFIYVGSDDTSSNEVIADKHNLFFGSTTRDYKYYIDMQDIDYGYIVVSYDYEEGTNNNIEFVFKDKTHKSIDYFDYPQDIIKIANHIQKNCHVTFSKKYSYGKPKYLIDDEKIAFYLSYEDENKDRKPDDYESYHEIYYRDIANAEFIDEMTLEITLKDKTLFEIFIYDYTQEEVDDLCNALHLEEFKI